MKKGELLNFFRFRDEGEANEVPSPQVIDLPPISTYLPEEHIERPALRSLLHNTQAMGSLEKLIRSVGILFCRRSSINAPSDMARSATIVCRMYMCFENVPEGILGLLQIW